MTDAKAKFSCGERVRLSEEGRLRLGKYFEKTGRDHGVVKGFGRDERTVRILRDGNSPNGIESFHMDFWEPDAR